MRTKIILSLLIITAVASTFGCREANAGLPGLPGLPAPPGVIIQISGGRPYYVEHGRRVYLKEKKHHRGRGHKHGHYKHK